MILGSFLLVTQSPAILTVREFLVNASKTKMIEDSQLQELRKRKGVLPDLAKFLPDAELGNLAQMAMLEIDAFNSTPYLLNNLQLQAPDEQRWAFRTGNRLILEYERSRLAEPEKPGTPPARWAPNTHAYPWKRELHAAAVRLCRKADRVDLQREMIWAIGLTGSRRDIGLLSELAKKNPNLSEAVLGAKTRLGDKVAFAELGHQIAEPLRPVPAEGYMTDRGNMVAAKPGAVVASREDGERIRSACEEISYSMDQRFVPMLLKHVDDPHGQWHGDYADPDPNMEARDALASVVLGKPGSPWTSEQWHSWAQAHGFNV